MNRLVAALAGAVVLSAAAFPVHADTLPPIIDSSARNMPVIAEHGMVVTQEKRASQIGVDVLKRGGNAVDAAVAVGFALAVTLPRAGNLGGGGFMLVHLGATGETIALDYRETAPAATDTAVFLDESGAADPKKSRDSGLGIGVPGTVAGLATALARWGSGKFTLAQLLAPAIALAHNGVPVDDDLLDSLPRAATRLGRWPASRAIFFDPAGQPLASGAILTQADLARTLERIAADGPDGFYLGETAARIVDAVRNAGGRMTLSDMRRYVPVQRKPVTGTYRGYEIRAMPPPSSGGVHVIQLLNVLEGFPLADWGAGSSQAIHVMAEAMKHAFADRAEWMGDPGFADMPLSGLMSKRYASAVAKTISLEHARPAADVAKIDPAPFEGDQTTHFSVVDAQGNAVANTYTLNFSYGSGLVADGTGVLLNNELDDFAAKPGVPNAFGLTGGAANAPGPGKRPLSSMTPTIVLRDGKLAIVTGSPGGPRIITTVLEQIVGMIDWGLNAAEAMNAVRFHHQWMPDELRMERGVSPDVVAALRAKGHTVNVRDAMGSVATIQIVGDKITGAADTRQRGTAAIGY